jgi:hypothetical protein
LQELRWIAMPHQFDFDSTHRILRCRFVGCVSDEELREYYRTAAQYIAQTDAVAGLTDFSEADAVEVSPQTIRELASLPPVIAEESRIRCVVAPTNKVFGLARMFELQGGQTRPNLHVVRTLKEALAILGVLAPKFEQLNPV